MGRWKIGVISEGYSTELRGSKNGGGRYGESFVSCQDWEHDEVKEKVFPRLHLTSGIDKQHFQTNNAPRDVF